MVTFKSLPESDNFLGHQNHHHLQPNGSGLEKRITTVGSSSNFGDRASGKTLAEMTNPFLSRAITSQAVQNDQNMLHSCLGTSSNVYSYNPSSKN